MLTQIVLFVEVATATGIDYRHLGWCIKCPENFPFLHMENVFATFHLGRFNNTYLDEVHQIFKQTSRSFAMACRHE